LKEGNSYHWAPSDGLSCIDCHNPTATVFEPTQYNVIKINEHGCESQIIYTINLNSSTLCNLNTVFIPNSFSPNNDGLNDEFVMTLPNAHADIKLNIFNRWGEQIFFAGKNGEINASGDKVSISWIGLYQNNQVQFNTYVYQLNTTCNGSKQRRMGHVNVIR